MVQLTQNQIITKLKIAGIARQIAREYDAVTQDDTPQEVFAHMGFDPETTSLSAVELAMKQYSGWNDGNMDDEIYRLSMSLGTAPASFTPLEDFDIIEPGHEYDLPIYDVEPGIGIVPRTGPGLSVTFVRGAIDSQRPKKAGTLHEHLIAMQIHDLTSKNSEVPHEETTEAIRCLKNALNHLRARKIDRITRRVLGTDQK